MSIIRLRGHYRVQHGRLLLRGNNLVTKAGLINVAKFIASVATSAPTSMKCGDSGATPTKDQTGLQGLVHATVATTGLVESTTDVLARITADFGVLAADLTIREFGLFTAGSQMFARFICREFTTNGIDPLTVEWELEVV